MRQIISDTHAQQIQRSTSVIYVTWIITLCLHLQCVDRIITDTRVLWISIKHQGNRNWVLKQGRTASAKSKDYFWLWRNYLIVIFIEFLTGHNHKQLNFPNWVVNFNAPYLKTSLTFSSSWQHFALVSNVIICNSCLSPWYRRTVMYSSVPNNDIRFATWQDLSRDIMYDCYSQSVERWKNGLPFFQWERNMFFLNYYPFHRCNLCIHM